MDDVNVGSLAQAVQAGDIARVRVLLNARPELVDMDLSESDEHRALHFAVLRRDVALVRLLMEAGADARKGIYPHRDATSAFVLARDREYHEIVAAIEAEEEHRRAEMSCPNSTISPIQEQISTAIRHCDNETAIRLLEEDGSLIHACDRQGATPLLIAADAGNEQMLDWLLKRRANVHKQDLRGWTALDRAARAADPRNDKAAFYPRIAARLLERGAELTISGAVAAGDANQVRALIAADASALRRTDMMGGLLTLAVNHGQLGMVRLLLDLGADVDERTLLEQLESPVVTWGMPLWFAALANRRDIVQLLLDQGADPNANVYASGWPLRNAWNHEDQSVKNLLLARGAKPQPYMVAEAHDSLEARRLLEEDTNEELARELLWSAADHGCPEIVEMAVRRLAWPFNDARWHWILIQPIRGAHAESSRNAGHFQCMEILLQRGVSPNIARYGQTPLHFAAAYSGDVSNSDRARFASQLLNHGARLDVRDDLLQSTALGWAARWNRLALAKLLIKRGAIVRENGCQRWATPTAWAEKLHHREMQNLLAETT